MVETLRLKTGLQLVQTEFASKDYFLKPIVFPGAIGMIHAWTGVGKTMLSLWMACAVSAGGSFARWTGNRPGKVCYVDTEMTGGPMKERFLQICEFAAFDVPDTDYMTFCTPDDYVDGNFTVPNPVTDHGQAMYVETMKNFDVLFFDNISTGTFAINGENEERTIERINNLWRTLRSMGKSVIFVHHSGKGGAQLGSSKREHLLDWTINLRRPSGYSASDGLKFEVHFEKARDFRGTDAEPFLCQVKPQIEGFSWEIKSLEESRSELVQDMKSTNMTEQQIAKETGLSLFTIKKLLLKGTYGDEGTTTKDSGTGLRNDSGDFRHESRRQLTTDEAF